jgi:hypothetical protein
MHRSTLVLSVALVVLCLAASQAHASQSLHENSAGREQFDFGGMFDSVISKGKNMWGKAVAHTKKAWEHTTTFTKKLFSRGDEKEKEEEEEEEEKEKEEATQEADKPKGRGTTTSFTQFNGDWELPWPYPPTPWIRIRSETRDLGMETSGTFAAIRGPCALGVVIDAEIVRIDILVDVSLTISSEDFSGAGGLLFGWLRRRLSVDKIIEHIGTKIKEKMEEKAKSLVADAETRSRLDEASDKLKADFKQLTADVLNQIESLKDTIKEGLESDNARRSATSKARELISEQHENGIHVNRFVKWYMQYHLAMMDIVREGYGLSERFVNSQSERAKRFVSRVVRVHTKPLRDVYEEVQERAHEDMGAGRRMLLLLESYKGVIKAQELATRAAHNMATLAFNSDMTGFLTDSIREKIIERFQDKDGEGEEEEQDNSKAVEPYKVIHENSLVSIKFGVKTLGNAEIGAIRIFIPGLSASRTLYVGKTDQQEPPSVTFAGADMVAMPLNLATFGTIGNRMVLDVAAEWKEYLNHPSYKREIRFMCYAAVKMPNTHIMKRTIAEYLMSDLAEALQSKDGLLSGLADEFKGKIESGRNYVAAFRKLVGGGDSDSEESTFGRLKVFVKDLLANDFGKLAMKGGRMVMNWKSPQLLQAGVRLDISLIKTHNGHVVPSIKVDGVLVETLAIGTDGVKSGAVPEFLTNLMKTAGSALPLSINIEAKFGEQYTLYSHGPAFDDRSASFRVSNVDNVRGYAVDLDPSNKRDHA